MRNRISTKPNEEQTFDCWKKSCFLKQNLGFKIQAKYQGVKRKDWEAGEEAKNSETPT